MFRPLRIRQPQPEDNYRHIEERLRLIIAGRCFALDTHVALYFWFQNFHLRKAKSVKGCFVTSSKKRHTGFVQTDTLGAFDAEPLAMR